MSFWPRCSPTLRVCHPRICVFPQWIDARQAAYACAPSIGCNLYTPHAVHHLILIGRTRRRIHLDAGPLHPLRMIVDSRLTVVIFVFSKTLYSMNLSRDIYVQPLDFPTVPCTIPAPPPMARLRTLAHGRSCKVTSPGICQIQCLIFYL